MTTPPESPNTLSRDEKIQRALLRAFVDKNYEKYQKKWDKAATTASKQSWNWAAFCFSLSWFAYRKMYVPAAIFIGLILVETIAFFSFGYAERYSRGFAFVLSVVAGQTGNTIYALHADKNINEVKTTLPSSHWVSQLRSKGGVNWWAGIGAMAACLVLLFVVFALFGQL